MTIIGFLANPYFVWSAAIGQSGVSDSILDIASCGDCFCPKALVAIHVLQHGPRGIEQRSVQPFGSSFLLRSVWNGQLMSDLMLHQMIFERARQVFTTIIRSAGTNFATGVIFRTFLPYCEIIQIFRLLSLGV
jgi:hypothetical protein